MFLMTKPNSLEQGIFCVCYSVTDVHKLCYTGQLKTTNWTNFSEEHILRLSDQLYHGNRLYHSFLYIYIVLVNRILSNLVYSICFFSETLHFLVNVYIMLHSVY